MPVLGEDVALGVGVAGDVEPVAAPALAVVRRGEQAIDEAGEGVGGGVAFEGVDLLGRRRHAPEVDGGAADQGPLVGAVAMGSFRPSRVGPG